MSQLAFLHAGQLVTLANGPTPRRGKQMRELSIIYDGGLVIDDGKISFIGSSEQVEQRVSKDFDVDVVDLEGRVVLPGFVDSHTHVVSAGTAALDFEQLIAGKTYRELVETGNGFHRIIRKTRELDEYELSNQIGGVLEQMVAHGTTAVDASTGFGLSSETEVRGLQVLKNLEHKAPLPLVQTLFAGNVLPTEFADRPDEYIELVTRKLLPQAALMASHFGVSCDVGGFTPEQAVKMLEEASGFRLDGKLATGIDGCQGITEALEAGVKQLIRLHSATDDQAKQVAASEAIATLLPLEAQFLGLPQAPARTIIDNDGAVAIATGYSPATSPSWSMPLAWSTACTQMKMSTAEALTACTVNGAAALGLADVCGTIEKGKHASLAIFNVEDYREIPYYMGNDLIFAVVLRGEEVIVTQWADDEPIHQEG